VSQVFNRFETHGTWPTVFPVGGKVARGLLLRWGVKWRRLCVCGCLVVHKSNSCEK